MLTNNNERLDIWLKLQNRFSYAEFVAACTFIGVEPHDAMEFAQKVGIISVAMTEYPELLPAEAYIKFVSEVSKPRVVSNIKPATVVYSPEPSPMPQTVQTKPCGSCGGGRVL